MAIILSLWLPILVAAVLVFIASTVIHMFLGYHKHDWSAVPNEDAFRHAVRPLSIPPGDYSVPRCASMKEMGTPEYQAKLNEGPVLMMTVLPNRVHALGKSLALWFVFSLLVGAFVAFVTGNTLVMGAQYSEVFCIAAAVAFAAYGLGEIPLSIWFSRSWATTARNLFDALVYALVTAGTFGWLWPDA